MSTKVRRRGQASHQTSDNEDDPANWPEMSRGDDLAMATGRLKPNDSDSNNTESRRARPSRNCTSNFIDDGADSHSAEDEGVIRCICGYDFDDGFTIQCDDCLVWQHGICVGISEDNVPKEYLCERCSPRWLDVKAAKERQRKRYENYQRRLREPRKRKEHSRSSTASNIATGGSTTATAATTVARTRIDATVNDQLQSRETRPGIRRRTSSAGVRSTSNGRSRTAASTNLSDSDHGNTADITPISPSVREHELEFTPLETSIYSACDDICRKLLNACSESPDFDPSEPLSTQFELSQTALTTPQHPVSTRRGIFTRTRVHTIVRRIKSSRGNAATSRYALYARQDQPKGRHVCELVGEVFPSKIYIDDRMNQYQLLGTVKQHVRLHPASLLCVDARHVGNDARFFRRSCRPNCVVRTVVLADVADGEDPTLAVRLCAFASRDIARGEELTLGWEFSPGHICGGKVPDPSDAERGEPEAKREARAAAYAALLALADCACDKRTICRFEKMRRWLDAYRRGANAAAAVADRKQAKLRREAKNNNNYTNASKTSRMAIGLMDDEAATVRIQPSPAANGSNANGAAIGLANDLSSRNNVSDAFTDDKSERYQIRSNYEPSQLDAPATKSKSLATSSGSEFFSLKKLWLSDYKSQAAAAAAAATTVSIAAATTTDTSISSATPLSNSVEMATAALPEPASPANTESPKEEPLDVKPIDTMPTSPIDTSKQDMTDSLLPDSTMKTIDRIVEEEGEEEEEEEKDDDEEKENTVTGVKREADSQTVSNDTESTMVPDAKRVKKEDTSELTPPVSDTTAATSDTELPASPVKVRLSLQDYRRLHGIKSATAPSTTPAMTAISSDPSVTLTESTSMPIEPSADVYTADTASNENRILEDSSNKSYNESNNITNVTTTMPIEQAVKEVPTPLPVTTTTEEMIQNIPTVASTVTSTITPTVDESGPIQQSTVHTMTTTTLYDSDGSAMDIDDSPDSDNETILQSTFPIEEAKVSPISMNIVEDVSSNSTPPPTQSTQSEPPASKSPAKIKLSLQEYARLRQQQKQQQEQLKEGKEENKHEETTSQIDQSMADTESSSAPHAISTESTSPSVIDTLKESNSTATYNHSKTTTEMTPFASESSISNNNNNNNNNTLIEDEKNASSFDMSPLKPQKMTSSTFIESHNEWLPPSSNLDKALPDTNDDYTESFIKPPNHPSSAFSPTSSPFSPPRSSNNNNSNNDSSTISNTGTYHRDAHRSTWPQSSPATTTTTTGNATHTDHNTMYRLSPPPTSSHDYLSEANGYNSSVDYQEPTSRSTHHNEHASSMSSSTTTGTATSNRYWPSQRGSYRGHGNNNNNSNNGGGGGYHDRYRMERTHSTNRGGGNNGSSSNYNPRWSNNQPPHHHYSNNNNNSNNHHYGGGGGYRPYSRDRYHGRGGENGDNFSPRHNYSNSSNNHHPNHNGNNDRYHHASSTSPPHYGLSSGPSNNGNNGNSGGGYPHHLNSSSSYRYHQNYHHHQQQQHHHNHNHHPNDYGNDMRGSLGSSSSASAYRRSRSNSPSSSRR